MNKKLVFITLFALASFGVHAGVKVTSLDLKTKGENGYFNIAIEGRSGELPDYKVVGNSIEITLSDAENFNSIFKNISGAQLSANVLNGKAVVKATLPYEIKSEGVNVGWKNKSIEVIFPRGKAATVKETAVTKVEPVKMAPSKPIVKSTNNSAIKEALNEDYLNNLMKEDQAKTVTKTEKTPAIELKKDEVSVNQAAISKDQINNNDGFSFAGYAFKFAAFLAVVLGMFYGVVQILKKGVFNRGKLGFLNNSQMIQVLSTTYVAPKRSLMVVKAHNQIFLVANSENGLTFLSEMTDTTGLLKEGEKQVTGTNFDINMGTVDNSPAAPEFKLKENIHESQPLPDEKGIAALTAKDIVKFSDELKKKAKKLKPIEFN